MAFIDNHISNNLELLFFKKVKMLVYKINKVLNYKILNVYALITYMY